MHSFAAMEGNMIMKDTERIVVIGTTTIMRESRTVNLHPGYLARILSDIKGWEMK